MTARSANNSIMKFLITGHTGFVGTNLISAFHNESNLFGLDIPQGDPNAPPPLPREKTFSWDQTDKLPEVDTIIHLAGKAHDTANVSTPEEYFEVNTRLTKRIFDHFMQSDSKTFIFFSSVKAVADSLENETLCEDRTPNPKTAYGQSKLAAEQYIINKIFENDNDTKPLNTVDFSDSSCLKQSDKRVYILRPCMIHGPGNKGNLNLLYKVVQKGLPWPLGAFHNKRSFLSINNLIFVMQHLVRSDIASGTYHLADDEPISTNELIGLIAKSLNRKPSIWNIPRRIIQTAAHTGDALRLPLNSERLQKLTESYVVSNYNIKRALNVQQMPVPAREGLTDTLRGFRQNTL